MPIINTVIASGGTTPAHYIEKTVDANGKLVTSTNIINLNGVTDVGEYVLDGDYRSVQFPANTSADLSSLTTISGSYACQNMFNNCRGLTSANLSTLTTISGSNACNYMFYNCRVLTSTNLPALTTISGSQACSSMFQDCIGLTSANLSALTTISGNAACSNMFQGCTSLATVYIGGTTAIGFGGKTNVFANIFSRCTQNIDVYAPAANQSEIEAMSGYPNFGGTGTVTWHWRS